MLKGEGSILIKRQWDHHSSKEPCGFSTSVCMCAFSVTSDQWFIKGKVSKKWTCHSLCLPVSVHLWTEGALFIPFCCLFACMSASLGVRVCVCVVYMLRVCTCA